MSALRNANRFVSRHRRFTALLGVLVVLGVAALNVHAALPEHHGGDGDATMCIASLSIAVLASVGWASKRLVDPPSAPIFRSLLLPCEGLLRAERPLPRARAGPLRAAVLRL